MFERPISQLNPLVTSSLANHVNGYLCDVTHRNGLLLTTTVHTLGGVNFDAQYQTSNNSSFVRKWEINVIKRSKTLILTINKEVRDFLYKFFCKKEQFFEMFIKYFDLVFDSWSGG